MPVRVLKHEPRCKLCAHPLRTEIDALLEQRSLSLKDEAGERINAVYVIAKLAAMEVVNPTKENLTVHWMKHCERITGAQVAVDVSAAAAALDAVDAQGAALSVDIEGNLRRLFALGIAEVEEKIKLGQRSGVTVDHLMKISDALLRRGQNEAQSELLKALGGGIEQVFAKALGGPAAIEPPIEDASFEEVAP